MGDRYRTTAARISNWPLRKLGEICEINPRKPRLDVVPAETMVSFVPMAAVNEHQISFRASETRPIGEVYNGYTYFADGDVLIAKVTPCFENGKSGIARGLKNGIGFGSSELFILRPKRECVLAEYIYSFICTDAFIEQGKQQMTGTGGLQRVPKDYIANFRIPVPPLSVQEKIVAEIESYQRIIDGARQVVENYKPTISIKPAWDTVELGSVASLKYGFTETARDSGDARFIRITDITPDGLLTETNQKYVDLCGENKDYV